MEEFTIVEWMLGLVGLGVVAVLARVWKIPAIEQKLDTVVRETDRNRDKIHVINNTLQHHEYRISSLEKTSKEKSES